MKNGILINKILKYKLISFSYFPYRNPVRRTGLIGRGILGRYGPNHICTAIFTR